MNLFDTIKFIETTLKLKTKSGEDLSGVSIEVDRYKALDKIVPLILIEKDKPSQIKTASKGEAFEYTHSLALLCVVSVKKDDWATYKEDAITMANKVIKIIEKTEDVRFRFFPIDTDPVEMMLGALKCSAVIIGYEVKTKFE